MFGGFDVNVVPGKLPQRVATGFAKVFGDMVGASYNPIAYLGSQVVNGTNHAVLAEQTLITGVDSKAIVVVILNEKPGDVDGSNVSIVEIKRVLAGTKGLGGINVDATIEIPAEALEVFNKHFEGFLGANNKPFALLATQVVNGIGYFFAVESSLVTAPGVEQVSENKSVNIVKVYSNYSELKTLPILGKAEAQPGTLGYAFTW